MHFIKKRCLLGMLIIVIALHLASFVFADASASRIIPQSYTPGSSISVQINIQFNETDCGGAFVDILPSGWNATDITGEGAPHYNTALNLITWAPLDATSCAGTNDSYVLTYTAVPNSSLTGPQVFSGQFSVDGVRIDIPNDTLYLQSSDFSPPTISFNGPSDENGSILNRSHVIFNVSARDNESGIQNLSVHLYDLSQSLISSQYSFSDHIDSNFSDLFDGDYYLQAIAFDNSNNSAISDKIFIKINTSVIFVNDTNITDQNDSNITDQNDSQIFFELDWNQWDINHTVNLSSYDSVQLKNLSNVTFSNSFGRITYLSNLSLIRSRNLTGKISISHNRIWIDSSLMPEFDHPAEITFFNHSLNNPILRKDGADCPSSICRIISINSTEKVFIANVTGFSLYELVEYSAPSAQSSGGGGGRRGGGGGIAVNNTSTANVTNVTNNIVIPKNLSTAAGIQLDINKSKDIDTIVKEYSPITGSVINSVSKLYKSSVILISVAILLVMFILVNALQNYKRKNDIKDVIQTYNNRHHQ